MADAFRLRLGALAPITGSGGTAVNSFTLNGSTDAVEAIFAADDAVTITRIGIRQSTLTGTAPVFRVSLQGVDASGNPDGSIKNSGNAYFDYTPTGGNNNTFQWLTLGAAYTCSRGEMLATVIAHQSGTIDGSNNCSFGVTLSGLWNPGLPYHISNDAGSRSRASALPLFGYGSAGRAYGCPMQTASSVNVNTGSTPDEVGVKFTIPSGWCSTYKVLGFSVLQQWPAARVTRAQLYDTDGTTVLQDVDRDTDHSQNTGSRPCEIVFNESSLATLTAGSAYRLTLTPQDATNQVHSHFEVATAADWDAWNGGQQFHWTQRTDAGAWTDTTTRKHVLELILTDITAPSGGSGAAFWGGLP